MLSIVICHNFSSIFQNCEKVIDLLELLDKWIDENPAVDQPVRFGNTAYRDWFTKLETVGFASMFCANMV